MSQQEQTRRAKSHEMSKRVAAFLGDFRDALISEDFGGYPDDLANRIVVAATPVVMDMAMKGIFK